MSSEALIAPVERCPEPNFDADPQRYLRNQALIDALADPTAVISAEGAVVMCNLAWERHGPKDTDRPAAVWTTSLDPGPTPSNDDRPSDPTRAAIASVLAGERGRTEIRLGSRSLWIRRFPGLASAVLVSSIDASRRQEYEQQDASTRQFDLVFNHAPIGMALIDLVGQFLQVNDAFCEMTGRGRQELCGLQAQLLVHPEDWDSNSEERAKLILGDIAAYQRQNRLLHATGRTIWCLSSVAAVCSAAGEPHYFITQYQDITKLKEAEADLDRLASHDSLTGLPNRTLFLDRLTVATARAERNPGSVAVLFVDLDRFKSINDNFGHGVGDKVLVEAASRLRRVLRPGDSVARLGGDEFAVCCEGIGGRSEAELIAERLNDVVRQGFEIDGTVLPLGISIGIRLAEDRNEHPERLIHDADMAMYQAKHHGRDRYAFFDAES